MKLVIPDAKAIKWRKIQQANFEWEGRQEQSRLNWVVTSVKY